MAEEAVVHFRDTHLWSRGDHTYARGEAFDGATLLDSHQLASLFDSAAGRDQFLAILRRLNGFFAVVRLGEGICWLAVDRVRSIPLFYGIRNGRVEVGDDCHQVERRVGDGQRSEVAKAEFLHLGYVTGPDTLCPHVKQCLAGGGAFFEITGKRATCEPYRYYRYKHQPAERRGDGQLASDHQRALEHVFGRLITWADGRTIVVPLSGGRDSRLIALMLRKLQYPNVIVVNYGRRGNSQLEISSRVAADLGFDWKFIPYSHRAWARWYHSDQRIEYQRYSGTLASLPHIQDWPAIWQLTRDGAIPADSVVVPGHTGDFLAGGRSTAAPELYARRDIDPERIVDASIKYHYSLWKDRIAKDPLWPCLVKRLRRQIGDIVSESAENNASVFETWNWENRQAKFIVNSVRVYDFYKLSWWLPLWDKEYLEFWAGIPLHLRVGKRWYNAFVDTAYRQVTGKSNPAARPMMACLKQVMSGYWLLRTVRKITKQPPHPMAEYANHPLCWYGLLPEDQFRTLYATRRNINSFQTAELLGKLTIRDPRIGATERVSV